MGLLVDFAAARAPSKRTASSIKVRRRRFNARPFYRLGCSQGPIMAFNNIIQMVGKPAGPTIHVSDIFRILKDPLGADNGNEHMKWDIGTPTEGR